MNRLVPTRGYGRLLTLVQPMASAEMVSIMNELLNVEPAQRLTDLDTTRKSLDDLASRWPGNRVFVVPDTSIYVEHRDRLEDLDFTTLVDLFFADTTVHVFMPIVVIDELDGLKDYQPASVRASYTLAQIDKLFPQPGHPVLIRPPARCARRECLRPAINGSQPTLTLTSDSCEFSKARSASLVSGTWP